MAEGWERAWRATMAVAPAVLRLGFRLEGDVPDPTGGVRHVIPGAGYY